MSGRYRIVQLIGKGGFGAVYKASDERFQSKRVVAIKEMSDTQLSPSQRTKAIQDFRNEAELLVELNHPNLPNVSDFFEEGNKAYLVMEFIEGKTLETLQEDAGGPLAEATVMDWALQLCAVLHYLHTRPKPIIFRDMKPSNVMLTADGQIKLIDFGIARIFKSAGTKDTTLLGSQGYAPLEQYGKGQSDASSRGISMLGITGGIPQLSTSGIQNTSGTNVVAIQTTQPTSSGNSGPVHTRQGAQKQQRLNITPQLASSPASTRATNKPISRRAVMIGAFVVGAAVVGGTTIALSQQHEQSNRPQTPLSPTRGTISIDFIYSTEKDAWLQQALADFKNNNARVGNKIVQVNASSQGSVQTKDAILNGTIKPVIWSPASSLELNQLNAAWNDKHGQDLTYSSGDYAAHTLVFSPLVFAVWQERVRLLLAKYGTLNWNTINDAINLQNWSQIGGKSDWGQVKLGQTRPDDSNSGLLSITLQAYAYYKIQRGLTVQQIDNNGFQKFSQQLETAVQQFGRSSGTYLQNEVIARGSAAYDIVPIYENLVITNQQAAINRQHQPLVPLYPDLNIVSDHPFAILNASGISDEAKEAARIFRDFLLSDQQQRNALLNGFRPYNANVQLTDKIAGNPFNNQPAGITIQIDISNQAQPPSGKVVDELLAQWTKQFGSASTALSATPQFREGQQINGITLA